MKRAGDTKRESLSQEDRDRLSALNQGASPREGEETAYQGQAGSVRRLLERVLELDERLNRRLAGGNSFYAQKK